MTWFDANISAPLSTKVLSRSTQCEYASVGSPVVNRTSTDVSTPKRRVIPLLSELVDVERWMSGGDLVSQIAELGQVDLA